MFIIVYGLLGTIGKETRSFFASQDFQVLEKIHYESEKSKTISRFEPRLTASKEEVSSSDFIYEANGIKVGFNKQQILDAVHGKRNIFTTISSNNFDFLKQIKRAYGDYVTIVYAYIDNHTLVNLLECFSNISNEEFNQRISTANIVKQTFLKNKNFFDDIVIYSGENSIFNLNSLFVQYRNIINASKDKEKKINSQRIVELPYIGNLDYLFVSYSHRDAKLIEPILFMLQREGYRIWYDEGLTGGENWKKVIKDKIKQCKNFMIFTSKNSVVSDDVKIEIITADNFEKKIINVQCDDSKFNGTYGQCLHSLHAISYNSPDIESELCDSLDTSIKER